MPRDSLGDFTFDFTFDFGRGGGGPRGPATPRDVGATGGPLSALPSALPSPGPSSTNPFPPGSRPPPFGSFPSGTAANDAIFKAIRNVGKIAKLSGLGTILISGAEILVAVVTGVQLENMADILRQQDLDIERLIARKLREKREQERLDSIEARARALEEAGPSPRDFPDRPTAALGPRTVPGVTPAGFPSPGPAAPPFSLPDPGSIQAPSPIAEPSPVDLPSPGPASRPAGLPEKFGVPAPLPSPSPVGLPAQLPFEVPLATPLTVFDPIPLGLPEPLTTSQFPQRVGELDLASRPLPLQQTKPDRKCEEVKRKRRRKGKCREGFFEEFPGRTRFITWRSRPCDEKVIREVL